MQSWVHLLLRSSGTRVPGALSRTGFREQDPGKRRRPRATTQTALVSSLEAKGTLRQRRHRLLPTHRKEAPPHAPLPRNPCRVPQPRRHIYQEPPRHPRYGPLLQARPAPSRGGNHLAATLDDDLRRVMEPRTSRPVRRLTTIQALARASIPVGVMIAPMIPGLNDHELPGLLSAAADAGAGFAA